MSADRDEDLDLVGVFRVLWSQKYLLAAVTMVCGIAAVIYAELATPIFRAEVVVTEVSDRGMGGSAALSSQFSGLASLAGLNIGQSSSDREARAVLQSRWLVEEFIKRYQLVGELFPHPKRPPSVWKAVQKFAGSVLTIREEPRKGTTTVSMDWTDAATASRWANGFVALANELIRTHALVESQRNIAYLTDQIGHTNVVELQRVMYSLIEGETKTLMLAEGRTEYAFRVVDPAVTPEIRVKPDRVMIVLVGLVVGILVGAMVALARNALRKSRARMPQGL